MRTRLFPMFGVAAAALCFAVAAWRLPGGFDWNRDYFSTLLRSESGARWPAVLGLAIFSLSIAIVFTRLAGAAGPSGTGKVIRIGGVGSMVYTFLTFTPMHDLMVKISVVFLFAAVLALLLELYRRRATGFFLAGLACFVLLSVSVTIYYSGVGVAVLPWAQRSLFVLFAVWLALLDVVGSERVWDTI